MNILLKDLMDILNKNEGFLNVTFIVNQLVKRGHKRTKCFSLFTPCVLQPIYNKNQNEYNQPLVIKKFSYLDSRPVYKLHKDWDGVHKDEIENFILFDSY